MKVPHTVRIAVLVIATTAFYGYVGQMVPQKEVQPPVETAFGSNMTTADMVKVGRGIMEGKGICVTCHTIGKTGALRFPDLGGIGLAAKTRVPGLSDVEYLAQSMYEPLAFVVPGFPPAMPPVNQPPIGLTDQEILSVIAALQTLGGTPTVTLQTKHRYNSGAAAPAPGGAPAQDAAPGEKQPLAAPGKGALLRPAVSSPAAATIATAGARGLHPGVSPGFGGAVVILQPVAAHEAARIDRKALRSERSVPVAMSHSVSVAPQAGVPAARSVRGGVEARPAGAERGVGAPASDGVGGSGGAKPPGLKR